MVSRSNTISSDVLQNAHVSALRCSSVAVLSFNRTKFGQQGGGILSKLAGSSLEFHEHRPYTLGDDPRFIDWGASAKTGETFVKVFRDEVAPLLDLIVDVSNSVSIDPKKESRIWEIVYWIVEWGRSVGVVPHIFLIADQYQSLLLEELFSYRVVCKSRGANTYPSSLLQQLPLRKHSLRVMTSDFLWPEDPERTLRVLSSGALLFAPRVRSEEEPEWSGNIVLADNESNEEVSLASSRSFLEDYTSRYKRHFLMWNEAAMRSKSTFVPIHSESDLLEELLLVLERATSIGGL
jgi:hypothetical protein